MPSNYTITPSGTGIMVRWAVELRVQGTIWHLGGLPPAIVDTITSARAPSTRCAYTLKSSLLVDWCFLTEKTPGNAGPSHRGPSISLVLTATQIAPFDPLLMVEIKILTSIKMVRGLQAFSVSKT